MKLKNEEVADNVDGLKTRLLRFAKKPIGKQYISLAIKLQQRFPGLPLPVRLPYGGWWLAGTSTVDRGVLVEGFEMAELRFVESYLKPEMTMFDIGAHHGLYTVLASKKIGSGGHAYAFEPSPRERSQLLRNLKLNRCKNVEVFSVALGRENGKGTLHLVDGTEDGCNSLRAPNVDQPTIPVEVTIQPLDEFLASVGVQKIDFMKLDVEGAELSVLQGATAFFASSQRPVILAEISDVRTQPWGYEAHEIVTWLSQRGYEWFELSELGGLRRAELSTSFQDRNLVGVPPEKKEHVRALLVAV